MVTTDFFRTISDEISGASPEIISKYNRPGPRYTSYPTAPEWDDEFGPADWRSAFEDADRRPDSAPLSLYLHLPFCHSLCLFCGCNVVISRNHEVTTPYLAHLKQEIEWISERLNPTRRVEQLHWGGGTPTYLSVSEIEDLYGFIAGRFQFAADAEIGIEIDPRSTNPEQCHTLKRLGFNRLSFGVQDFDPIVQQTIHRIQPFSMVKDLVDHCRQLEFESINVDLIYGLPHQTTETFESTVDRILEIGPDRIALFSYAHVPWLKKQQGSFAKHLPEGMNKFQIFRSAITKLVEAGYRYIGMDHFARPADELCRAQDDRTLHRNFQGYTTKRGCDLFAFGVSAINSLDDVYAQNWRDLPHYYEAIDAGRIPTMRGMRISAEDKLRRAVINRLLCHTVVIKAEIEKEFEINFDTHFAPEMEVLSGMQNDGMLRISPDRIEVTGLGRVFIRNAAMAFDAYLNKRETNSERLFSRTL